MSVEKERWERAQEYERSYWTMRENQIATGVTSDLAWYQWRADQLVQTLRESGHAHLTHGTETVLEVGSGPVGIVSFFPAAVRIAVDPLAGFFNRNAALTVARGSGVSYLQAKGEELPVRDGRCRLVMLENCIDHVQDIDALMTEITRVLTGDGLLYLTVNCRTRLGFRVHRLLSRLEFDTGHPHTFTSKRVRELLSEYHFRTAFFHVASYREALRKDLGAGSRRSTVKGVLGVSEFLISAVGVLER